MIVVNSGPLLCLLRWIESRAAVGTPASRSAYQMAGYLRIDVELPEIQFYAGLDRAPDILSFMLAGRGKDY